jgi:hypothetical protein
MVSVPQFEEPWFSRSSKSAYWQVTAWMEWVSKDIEGGSRTTSLCRATLAWTDRGKAWQSQCKRPVSCPWCELRTSVAQKVPFILLFMSMGWDCVELRPPMGLVFIPQKMRVWRAAVELYRQGKTENSERNLSRCHCVRHKSHTDWPEREPRLPWWETGD